MSIFDDVGGESESIQTAEVEVEQSAPAQIDSTTDAAPSEPSTQTESPAAQGEEGQEAPAASEEVTPPTEDEVAALEKDVETALADERTPKWFKNAVENVYKPKLQALTEQVGTYEPLTQFGTVEEIQGKLDRMSKLGVVKSNASGMPELSTREFVDETYKEDPKLAYQLLNDLADLPSPTTQGWTVLHEILKGSGIDPSRLEDHKNFAANGYQLQQGQYPPPDAEELAQIPKELQPTFASLSPERREAMMADPEHVRNANLEDAKTAIDAKTRDATQKATDEQRQAEEKQKADMEFANTVNAKGFEHFQKSGEAVFTSFVDSLAKQANLSRIDSVAYANTVMSSFEPTVQGKASLEALKADGIIPDPAIPATITQLEENGKHIAYYDAVQDRPNYERAVAKQVELQERLTAKSNKIIAALALKKSQGTAKTIQDKLLAPPNSRYAAAGVGSQVGSNGQVNYDFDDSAYLEDLRNDPAFGNRR